MLPWRCRVLAHCTTPGFTRHRGGRRHGQDLALGSGRDRVRGARRRRASTGGTSSDEAAPPERTTGRRSAGARLHPRRRPRQSPRCATRSKRRRSRRSNRCHRRQCRHAPAKRMPTSGARWSRRSAAPRCSRLSTPTTLPAASSRRSTICRGRKLRRPCGPSCRWAGASRSINAPTALTISASNANRYAPFVSFVESVDGAQGRGVVPAAVPDVPARVRRAGLPRQALQRPRGRRDRSPAANARAARNTQGHVDRSERPDEAGAAMGCLRVRRPESRSTLGRTEDADAHGERQCAAPEGEAQASSVLRSRSDERARPSARVLHAAAIRRSARRRDRLALERFVERGLDEILRTFTSAGLVERLSSMPPA